MSAVKLSSFASKVPAIRYDDGDEGDDGGDDYGESPLVMMMKVILVMIMMKMMLMMVMMMLMIKVVIVRGESENDALKDPVKYFSFARRLFVCSSRKIVNLRERFLLRIQNPEF